jgi:hypothetical protein
MAPPKFETMSQADIKAREIYDAQTVQSAASCKIGGLPAVRCLRWGPQADWCLLFGPSDRVEDAPRE